MLKINVEDVRRGTKGHILASCRVTLTTENGDEFISIFDVRVLRNRSGGLWVGFPTQSTRDFEGMKYVPNMEFSKNLKRRISEAVLAEFEREDAEADVRSKHMQVPAVRPAVAVPIRRPDITQADIRASFQFHGKNLDCFDRKDTKDTKDTTAGNNGR
jgi:DNA-binding cell septation regulator SpoVG